MLGRRPIKKVLIVDDERDLLEPLALRVSGSGGYDVAVAYDGEEGLQKALSFQPDLVLVDLAMPGMDGWELCRRLHENTHTRGAALVIMTAWASKDVEKRALSEGVAKVLLKPFEDDEFMAALSAATAAPPRTKMI